LERIPRSHATLLSQGMAARPSTGSTPSGVIADACADLRARGADRGGGG
jgi:hypothetical protein